MSVIGSERESVSVSVTGTVGVRKRDIVLVSE